MISTRQLGKIGEDIAERYLKNKGYKILEKNYGVKGGEIDIVACDGDCLVFVEVKYRTTSYMDYGFKSVDNKKRQRIIKTAKKYLLEKELEWDREMRFDVIDIFENEITHYEGAFGEGVS